MIIKKLENINKIEGSSITLFFENGYTIEINLNDEDYPPELWKNDTYLGEYTQYLHDIDYKGGIFGNKFTKMEVFRGEGKIDTYSE